MSTLAYPVDREPQSPAAVSAQPGLSVSTKAKSRKILKLGCNGDGGSAATADSIDPTMRLQQTRRTTDHRFSWCFAHQLGVAMQQAD
jgi:hypothetical protein